MVEHIEILAPKQILQRLLTAFVQVKAGNTSENLLNENIFFVFFDKEITKNIYYNIMNLIKS